MNVFSQVGQAPNIETNVLKSMMMDVLMKWMMLMLSILWGEILILHSLVTVTTSQKELESRGEVLQLVCNAAVKEEEYVMMR